MGARQSRRASIVNTEAGYSHNSLQNAFQPDHGFFRRHRSSTRSCPRENDQSREDNPPTRIDHVNEFIVSRELIGLLTPQELENIALENSLAYSPLPFGWEKTSDQSGSTYFIDHLNRSTTFQDPRLPSNSFKPKVSPPSYEFTLYNRCQHLRAKLFKLYSGENATGRLLIQVERESVFEDSLALILPLPVEKLISRLHIKFNSEKGLDYGGMSREWFLELSREITKPERGFFLLNINNYTYTINSSSRQLKNYKKCFEFIGTILGMAIYHGMLLPCFFCDSFYKYLLDLPVSIEDLKSYDKQIYQSLKYIQENNQVDELGLYFTLNDQEKNEIQLKEKGNEIPLTNQNKREYIRLCVDYYLKYGKKEQYKNLKKGFRKLIPKEYLVKKYNRKDPYSAPNDFKLVEGNFNDYNYDVYAYFTLSEVKSLLGGEEVIDVYDLQRWTQYEIYNKNDTVIKWFWEIVLEMDQQDLSLLLQFVTGTHRVPVGGFEHLYGSNGPCLFTLTRIDYIDGKLPSAHSCFNRLDLPEYPRRDLLKRGLYYAITETKGFNLE